MSPFEVKPLAHPLKGKIIFPPDKSITHRAVILSSISRGKTQIKKFAINNDCLSTIKALRDLGVKIKIRHSSMLIIGRGLRSLVKSRKAITAGESGTTMRLLLGVLAGQDFPCSLIAGKSLTRRPMLRVITPLRKMGAEITARRKIKNSKIIEEYPPITISGGNLKAITYKLPVASAQVKSAILLAGLYASGITRIVEPIKTRDHTEKMFKLFGAEIKTKARTIFLNGGRELFSPLAIDIPGDISSASFYALAATFFPGSCLIIKSVGLNTTRLGGIRILKKMGAKIKIIPRKLPYFGYEPIGDIIVKSSSLKATAIKRQEIPSLIDEVPLLLVAASIAKGSTLFEGVEELKVKETDRIYSMVSNLRRMGAKIKVKPVRNNGLNIIVTGVQDLAGNKVRSFGDHRTAMSMIIAGLKARGATLIDDIGCINKSFPDFIKILHSLIK